MSPSGPSPSPSRNPPVSPARDQRGASRAAAAASLASLDAPNPSQSLSGDGDGPSPNGPSLSGLSLNGPSPNGPSPNGPSLNLNCRESLARDRRDPREASLAVAASLASQDAPSLNQSPSGPPGPYLSGPRGLSLNLSLSHLARAAREARVPREARDPREARVQRVIVGRLRLTTPAKNSLIVDFSSDLNCHACPRDHHCHVIHLFRVVARMAECVLVIEGSVGHVGFCGE